MNVKLEYIDAIDGGIVMKVVNDADAPGLSTTLANRGYHVLNVEQLADAINPLSDEFLTPGRGV